MRAHDLAEPCASVAADEHLLSTVAPLTDQRSPAVLVLDATGQPCAALVACVPGDLPQDLPRPHLIDEPHADLLRTAPDDRQLSHHPTTALSPLPAVTPRCTTREIAQLMVRARCPVVAVMDTDADGSLQLLGTVTADRLLEQFLRGAYA
jgi:hypothetical protein